MSFIVTPLAAILTGIFASMGLGGGGILIIYLTVVAGMDQTTAQGINLVFFIPISFIAILFYYKKKIIDWKIALIASSVGILGAILGSCLSAYIDSNILSKVFGIFLFFIGINQLFGGLIKKFKK